MYTLCLTPPPPPAAKWHEVSESSQCHQDNFYQEILVYRAKALLALGHENAVACCQEVRWLEPGWPRFS